MLEFVLHILEGLALITGFVIGACVLGFGLALIIIMIAGG